MKTLSQEGNHPGKLQPPRRESLQKVTEYDITLHKKSNYMCIQDFVHMKGWADCVQYGNTGYVYSSYKIGRHFRMNCMPPSLNNTLYLHTATTGCRIIAISGHGGGLEDTQLQPPRAPAECTSAPLPVINTAEGDSRQQSKDSPQPLEPVLETHQVLSAEEDIVTPAVTHPAIAVQDELQMMTDNDVDAFLQHLFEACMHKYISVVHMCMCHAIIWGEKGRFSI